MAAVDKLSIINSALVRTGNEPLNVSDDSSDAWTVGSQAYEDALPVLLEARDWNFQTAITDLQRVGSSNFPGYSDVYAKPTTCLHLQVAWRTDLAGLVTPSLYYGSPRDMVRPPQMDYRIIGDQIHCIAPAGAQAKFVQQPSGSLTSFPALFNETLKLMTMAGIFLGLNEDMAGATAMWKLAQEKLDEASARKDQEEPRRAAFRSYFTERRRGRTGFWAR